jgi:hypothetical protein
MRQNFDFKLQGQDIKVVDTYSYVGLIFKCNEIVLIERRKLELTKHRKHYTVYGRK